MDRFNRTGGLSKASNGPTPVPAARTNQLNKQDPISSGLLISVIKTLTSTVSDDQRQLERSRLEKGYQDSGLVIDRLLDEHQCDVSECMNSFRKVSNGITGCRERIHNVKNALHTCKSLLQCRRDDLKKLWMESAEQRYMSNILQQIHEMKHMDQTIEQFVRDAKYREAVDALKRADILLNGPLSQIDGLNQLRTNVIETSQTLFEKIVQDLLHSVVVVPFDIQNLELMKSIGDSVINESVVCVTIIARYASGGNSTGGGPSSTLPSHLLPIIASHQQRSDLAGASSSNYGANGKSNTTGNSEETPVLLAKINESLEALKNRGFSAAPVVNMKKIHAKPLIHQNVAEDRARSLLYEEETFNLLMVSPPKSALPAPNRSTGNEKQWITRSSNELVKELAEMSADEAAKHSDVPEPTDHFVEPMMYAPVSKNFNAGDKFLGTETNRRPLTMLQYNAGKKYQDGMLMLGIVTAVAFGLTLVCCIVILVLSVT